MPEGIPTTQKITKLAWTDKNMGSDFFTIQDFKQWATTDTCQDHLNHLVTKHVSHDSFKAQYELMVKENKEISSLINRNQQRTGMVKE